MLADSKRTQLNRALSKLGFCSRGVAERWIAAGRVAVNGRIAESPESWVELGRDRIEVLPETGVVSPPSGSAPMVSGSGPIARDPVYLILHKPVGCVTTRQDELGRRTVYDLLPEAYAGGWVFPVGRLDKDSEGLLLMTNDGEWANLLTDPEFHVEKVYLVKLDGRPREDELQRFRTGIMLEGSLTLPAGLEAMGGEWFRVRLIEGRNRQIRRMFHELGYKVKRLIRTSIGDLEMGDLAAGQVKALDPERVRELRAAARQGGGKAGRRPHVMPSGWLAFVSASQSSKDRGRKFPDG